MTSVSRNLGKLSKREARRTGAFRTNDATHEIYFSNISEIIQSIEHRKFAHTNKKTFLMTIFIFHSKQNISLLLFTQKMKYFMKNVLAVFVTLYYQVLHHTSALCLQEARVSVILDYEIIYMKIILIHILYHRVNICCCNGITQCLHNV